MKKIPLTSERFEVMYEGLLNTPRGFTAPSETRIVGKVLSKLEELGHQTEVMGIRTYRMNGEMVSPDLPLTEEELSLVTEALKAVKWMGRSARQVSDLFETFEKAPSE